MQNEFEKDELEMEDEFELSKDVKIFTTGAFLRAFEVEINGVKSWRWIVVGQEGDAFLDNEIIEVYDYADSFEGLFIETEDEYDEEDNDDE